MLNPAFWAGRRVLVTGHTGFKGSWLLLWLHQLGAQVWGYALEPEGDPNLFSELFNEIGPTPAIHHQIGDLADAAALAELVRRSYHDPLGTWAPR